MIKPCFIFTCWPGLSVLCLRCVQSEPQASVNYNTNKEHCFRPKERKQINAETYLFILNNFLLSFDVLNIFPINHLTYNREEISQQPIAQSDVFKELLLTVIKVLFD